MVVSRLVFTIRYDFALVDMLSMKNSILNYLMLLLLYLFFGIILEGYISSPSLTHVT